METLGLDRQILEEARAAKTAEELEDVCTKDGVELRDEVLEDVEGGTWTRIKIRCKNKG